MKRKKRHAPITREIVSDAVQSYLARGGVIEKLTPQADLPRACPEHAQNLGLFQARVLPKYTLRG